MTQTKSELKDRVNNIKLEMKDLQKQLNELVNHLAKIIENKQK